MANGIRYETGRDMPFGMLEKLAIQIAKQKEAEAAYVGAVPNMVRDTTIVSQSAESENIE